MRIKKEENKGELWAIFYTKNGCVSYNTAEKNIRYYCDKYLLKKSKKIGAERKISFYDCKFDDERQRYFVLFYPEQYFKKSFFSVSVSVSNLLLKHMRKYKVVRKIKFNYIYNKMIKSVNDIYKLDDKLKNDDDENQNILILTNLFKENGISKIILDFKRDMECREIVKYGENYYKYGKILLVTYHYNFRKFYEDDFESILRILSNSIKQTEITSTI